MQQDNYDGLRSCTACGIRLMIPFHMLGACAQCPQCGKHFIVKDGDTSEAQSRELDRRVATALNRPRQPSSIIDGGGAADVPEYSLCNRGISVFSSGGIHHG